jgi:transposase
MHQVRDILYRLRQGQSERRIARDLGCSRKTIRRYHDLSDRFGYLDPACPLPTESVLLADLGPAIPPPSPASSVEPYRDYVTDQLSRGVEMAAIHQRLQDSHGYRGSYSSVRRFVAHVSPPVPRVVVRVETEPGHVGQVDFGTIGKLINHRTGQLSTAHCFVMTLGFSRHMYVEFVFDQSIATWVCCHINAFDFFGGVVREIVLDNLKAAVLVSDLEDTVLSVPYSRLAQHYGFLVHPCIPRTPRHKGKCENQVHYVKRNLVAGRDFADDRDANRAALDWIMGRAGERIHGTTRMAPLRLFQDEEKAVLLPLPCEPFELRTVRTPKVHPDCHINLDKAYYSLPDRYVGKTVEAHILTNTVAIYHQSVLVRTYPRATREGQRITCLDDYPPDKAVYLRRTPKYCRETASQVGERCRELVDLLFSAARPLDKLRAVQGVIGLIDKVGSERLEAACRRALAYHDPSYRRVKSILNSGTENLPLPGVPILKTETSRQYTFARTPQEFFEGLFDEEVFPC